MSSAGLAWIGDPDGSGRWGSPAELAIPLDDRGLLLADGLFETVLVEHGEPRLLAAHVERWQGGASLLGMARPPSLPQVGHLAAEAVRRSGIRHGALRLNWSRGGGGRGIAIPAAVSPQEPRFWLQLSPASPSFEPAAVIVSPSERRCATSLLSRCKTFAYGPAIQARRQAQAAGADDALLESSAGGLCCGTTANLLLAWHDRWLTPAVSSGCLPGVMRQRALQLGLIAEAPTPVEPHPAGEPLQAAWLLNSLGCRPVRSIAGRPLPSCDPAASERFWRRLLDGA